MFIGMASRGQIERTFALLKPGVADRSSALADAFRMAQREGLEVVWQSSANLTLDQAESFYGAHRGRFFYQRLIVMMSNGPVDAFVLQGQDAVAKWRHLLGPTHRDAAREKKGCLRGKYGDSDTRNAFHGSGSVEEALEEETFFKKVCTKA